MGQLDMLMWLIPVVTVGIVLLSMIPIIFFLVRMLRNSQMRQQTLQRGVDATATIVRTWDTGVRINDNPQVGMALQVQPPNGVPFQAEVTQTVSIVHLPMFQPGTQLQVKYDPANPKNVAIVSVLSGAGAATGGAAAAMNPAQVEQMLMQQQALNEQITRTGQPATAKVLQYTPMGINVNGNNPAVNLMLEVHPASGAPFIAQAQGIVVAEASVPKYQPGQMVTVRYNPADLTKVAVERSGT